MFRIQQPGVVIFHFPSFLVKGESSRINKPLWLQFILAGIGTDLFENVSAMVDYFLENPFAAQCSMVYFWAGIVVIIVAMVMRF